jgi:hypothetical protein
MSPKAAFLDACAKEFDAVASAVRVHAPNYLPETAILTDGWVEDLAWAVFHHGYLVAHSGGNVGNALGRMRSARPWYFAAPLSWAAQIKRWHLHHSMRPSPDEARRRLVQEFEAMTSYDAHLRWESERAQ